MNCTCCARVLPQEAFHGLHKTVILPIRTLSVYGGHGGGEQMMTVYKTSSNRTSAFVDQVVHVNSFCSCCVQEEELFVREVISSPYRKCVGATMIR